MFDLGTGLRYFGRDQPHDGSFRGTCLLSHLHWDHTQGLPFFVPVLRPGAQLDIYGPPSEGMSLEEAFRQFVRPPFFPVEIEALNGEITFHDLLDDQVVVGDANTLPFAPGSFGAAVSIDVICHAGLDEAKGLAELHRVLATGGTVVANLPAYEWMRSAHDARVHTARRYTAASARRAFAAAGFIDISARYWNSLLFPLMALQRKVLARRADAPSDVTDFPPWLDHTLHAVSETERRIGGLGIPMPGGGSVLVVATRP